MPNGSVSMPITMQNAGDLANDQSAKLAFPAVALMIWGVGF
jgi:hypothetical protein